jgi:hypothetical protein
MYVLYILWYMLLLVYIPLKKEMFKHLWQALIVGSPICYNIIDRRV